MAGRQNPGMPADDTGTRGYRPGEGGKMKMAKMIIYHHNDLDGRCSAAIMTHFAQNKGWTEIIYHEVDYASPIDINEINPEDTVSVLDFSFKPEVMAQVRARAVNVFWCDHHKTAQDYKYDDIPGVRDFGAKGLSGCECTWKFCYETMKIPRAVKLIGDYDSWRLETAPVCFEFYEGMKFSECFPGHPWWYALMGFTSSREQEDGIINRIIAEGRIAIRYRDTYCEDMAKGYGYETSIGGHRAFAMNVYRFGSKQFGERMKMYPVCVAYVHNGEKFTVSLYSEGVDVSELAKKFGGGGHKGAAGFVCDTLPFLKMGVKGLQDGKNE
jgi:oligoribonuclease NrnB/cAMP/cGMP phosphodiesterase (DHH superfamily)